MIVFYPAEEIVVSHSHQFCVSAADGNPVMAVWNSDLAVNINLLRWVVATRMEYSLRSGHCTVDHFDPHDCGGTTIYHLDARGPEITDDRLFALVGGSASEIIAAIMTIEVTLVAEGRDPILDTRVAEPAPNHASSAHARFQQIWEQIH